MKKFFIFLISFYIGFIIFMPKSNLLFSLEKYLKHQNIYLNATYKENIFKLNIKNAKIFINKINLIDFKEAHIMPFIFYNKLEIKNIFIHFQNLKVSNLDINYSILNPLKILIKGNSNFGKIEGFVNLKDKFIKIYILNLTNNNIKSFLQKDKKGYFYYAKF